MSTVYWCLDPSTGREKHWLGQANSKVSGCPTCLRVSKWRKEQGIENTISDSHRFPEYLRYMTSASVTRSWPANPNEPCRRCGHTWRKHTKGDHGPCLGPQGTASSGECDRECSNFVREGEPSILTELPTEQGEVNMQVPYEYMITEWDKEVDRTTVLVEPTLVMAIDEAEVRVVASRAIPETSLDNLRNIAIIVKPWGGNRSGRAY